MHSASVMPEFRPVAAPSFWGVTTASASRLVVSVIHRWRRTMDTNHIPIGTYRVATGPETFSVHSAYNFIFVRTTSRNVSVEALFRE